MEILSPTGTTETPLRALARRRPSLRGLRIGLLDNSKPNADVLLGRAAELLAERAGAASIRRWRKPGSSRPSAEVEEIASAVDVVLTGTAD
jgi:hypothetical protein